MLLWRTERRRLGSYRRYSGNYASVINCEDRGAKDDLVDESDGDGVSFRPSQSSKAFRLKRTKKMVKIR